MRLRKSSLITKLILLTLTVFAIVTIVRIRPQTIEQRRRCDIVAEQVQAKEQKIRELQQDIDQLGTDEAVRKIARDRLNLVGDGEIVFIDSGK